MKLSIQFVQLVYGTGGHMVICSTEANVLVFLNSDIVNRMCDCIYGLADRLRSMR